MNGFLQHLRYTLRQLRKNLGFTTVAVLTLALGIGATTAICSIVDSSLFRPLPYPNSPRIVRIWNTFTPRGMIEIPASKPEFLEYRQSRTFAHFARFSMGPVTLTGTGDPLRVAATWGTSDLFQVMGTNLLLGRVFTSDEFQPGQCQVATVFSDLDAERAPAKSDPMRVVVNETLVRQLFAGQHTVGKHFRLGSVTGPEFEITGVVSDAKYMNPRDTIWPTVYTPIAGWDGPVYLEVRTAMDPKVVMPEIRAEVSRFDNNLLITGLPA
jgi:hypothetical protein